jgi:tetratricopeptide (TPR) repeat protein
MGRHAAANQELDLQIADPTLSAMTSAGCLLNRAEVSRKGGDAPGALRYAQLALQRLHEAGNARTIDEGIVLARIGSGMKVNGRNAEARQYFRQALENYRAAVARATCRRSSSRAIWPAWKALRVIRALR